jgi:hypothetical protein
MYLRPWSIRARRSELLSDLGTRQRASTPRRDQCVGGSCRHSQSPGWGRSQRGAVAHTHTFAVIAVSSVFAVVPPGRVAIWGCPVAPTSWAGASASRALIQPGRNWSCWRSGNSRQSRWIRHALGASSSSRPARRPATGFIRVRARSLTFAVKPCRSQPCTCCSGNRSGSCRWRHWGRAGRRCHRSRCRFRPD